MEGERMRRKRKSFKQKGCKNLSDSREFRIENVNKHRTDDIRTPV